MKNKKTAYFMVPLVLAIWGMIGWKVYAAMRGKNDASNVAQPVVKIKAAGAEIPDTVSLLVNYRDPFLDKMVVPKNPNAGIRSSDVKAVKLPEAAKPVAIWPVLAYHGLIKRNSDQKTLGFLNVSGQAYFVQAGDGAGEVKVNRLWKDSVEVVWGKEKKIISNQ